MWAKLYRSTAVRMALLVMVVFAVAELLVVGYIYTSTNLLFSRQLTRTINAEVQALSQSYQTGGMPRLINMIEQRAAVPGGTLYLLTDSSGRALAGNLLSIPSRLAGPPGWVEFGYEAFEAGERRFHLARARTFRLEGGFSLMVGRDVGEQRRFEQVITSALVWSLGLTLLIGLLAGFLVSRRMLVRIGRMTATSRRIMAGDLSERIAETGSGDEIDQLARSLNEMLDRIERLLQGLREVSDNIAHDLKTPLTRMRTQVEAALRSKPSAKNYRAALEQTIEDSDHLIKIFEALLSIARAEAGSQDARMSDIDGAAMLRDIAELYEPVAEDSGCRLRVEAEEKLTFRGNRDLISQALANVLDNALKYGHAGSSDAENGTEIVVGLAHEEAGVAFSVRDCGPGIPKAERERVLQRFVRLESSRSQAGIGLGLSLVAAVVRLHGGTLRLEDNQECDHADAGPGLSVSMVFPLVDEAESR